MEAETTKTKLKKEKPPWQPPEVTAREATAEETPKPAADLARVATEHGWEAVITYARGTTDTDTPKLIHSIAVRMTRGAQRAAAVWTSPVEMKVLKKKRKVATGEMELVPVIRKRGGVHSLAPTWTSLVELGITKGKGKVRLSEETALTKIPRKRPASRRIVSQRASFLKLAPVIVEIEEEVLEQVWTFDFAARPGRWRCQKSGLSGIIPIKLSSSDLKLHLAIPPQVSNSALPADVWAAGMDTEMIEGLERLASLFAGEETAESSTPA